MNKLIILLLGLCMPLVSYANIIEVKIKGVVCAFCSIGVRKNLIKTGKVKAVICDAKKQLSIIYLKEHKNLSDKEIKVAVTKAGYSIYKGGIFRKPCKINE